MSAHFTVERVAGDGKLSDDEVVAILGVQMRRVGMRGGTLKISVLASEAQIDKAMQQLMLNRVARFETICMRLGIPIPD